MSTDPSHKEEGGGHLSFHRLLVAEGPGYLERFGAGRPPRQSQGLRANDCMACALAQNSAS